MTEDYCMKTQGLSVLNLSVDTPKLAQDFIKTYPDRNVFFNLHHTRRNKDLLSFNNVDQVLKKIFQYGSLTMKLVSFNIRGLKRSFWVLKCLLYTAQP